MWLYSTFDNVDGKQARRTNSSSPLGELFDHVCDALNCSIGAVVQVAAMGLGVESKISMLIPFLSIFAFFLSTWEEYHTGTLFLGYINGPTEGLIISCCTMIISGIYGPSIWKTPVSAVPGLAPIWDLIYGYLLKDIPGVPVSITLVEFLAGFMVLSLVFMHIPPCFWAVARVNHRKGKSILAAYFQVSTIVVYFAAAFIWITSPVSVALKEHYIIFLLSIGILFGMIAGNIILAHLTKGPFPYWTILMAPLVLGALLFNEFYG